MVLTCNPRTELCACWSPRVMRDPLSYQDSFCSQSLDQPHYSSHIKPPRTNEIDMVDFVSFSSLPLLIIVPLFLLGSSSPLHYSTSSE